MSWYLTYSDGIWCLGRPRPITDSEELTLESVWQVVAHVGLVQHNGDLMVQTPPPILVPLPGETGAARLVRLSPSIAFEPTDQAAWQARVDAVERETLQARTGLALPTAQDVSRLNNKSP